jgi:hypothetical protein
MSEIETTPAAGAAVGSCKTCGYSPVAFGARACPHCGTRNPNPGVCDRITGRAMLIGLVGGFLVGGVLGYCSKPEDGAVRAIAGALPGAIVGLIVGLVGGLMLSFVAWLTGKR